MIDSKLVNYFENFFKFIENTHDKKPSDFYHLPCIFIDSTDFVPASNEKVIKLFINEFILKNFLSGAIEIRNFNIEEISQASKTLKRVKINFEVFEQSIAKARIGHAIFTIMIKGDFYKIVTTELINLEVPQIEGITLNKNVELSKKFLKYRKAS